MKLTVLSAFGLVLSAVPVMAQMPMTPKQYVAAAGASDLFERMSSRIVLATTADPAVKSFAMEMITDHTKSTSMVKKAAMKSHVMAAPPKLNPQQTELITQLKAETGTARDTTYIAQQKAAHDQALSVQQAYATDGTAMPLKMVAADIVPVVQHHIEMLKTM